MTAPLNSAGMALLNKNNAAQQPAEDHGGKDTESLWVGGYSEERARPLARHLRWTLWLR